MERDIKPGQKMLIYNNNKESSKRIYFMYLHVHTTVFSKWLDPATTVHDTVRIEVVSF